MKKQRTELGPDCKMHLRGVEDTVYLLGGKWKTIIISHLYFAGKMRFMDLKRQLEKVAAKTLSKELKELEMNNLVTRIQNNTMPVTVDYELTDFGKSLHDVIDTMSKWGINYRNELLRNGNK